MEEWDAQKMLDLYIHDYLVRKNMHHTAEILAKEADIHPKSVVINPPEGFLSEWWSLFWDLYTSRILNNPLEEQASTSLPTQSAGSVPQNAPPMQQNMSPAMRWPGFPDMLQTVNPTAMPMPELQTMSPTMQRPGFPDILQTVNPTTMLHTVNPKTMAMPEMGSMMHNPFSTMMPKMDFNPNRLGPSSSSGNGMRQEQIMADLVTEKVLEQEQLRLPSNSSVLSVDQLARLLPMASSSSHHKKKYNYKRQHSITRDVSTSSSLGRSITQEQTPQAPKLIQGSTEHADTGRKKVNQTPSDGRSLTGFGYADNTPVSNEQTSFSAPSAGGQADSAPDLAAQASRKLIISVSESPVKMVNPILIDDSPKGKSLQIGKSTEMEKPSDEDIESFFSVDEAPDNVNIFTHTLPQSSSAQKQKDQQEFPFGPVRSLHPTNNKLSCCDFSTQGKFLAAAGHEKKVFIWNLRQSTRHTIQGGHSQIITDLRFKPNSNIFATCSFDRSVKIWDASNPKKPLFNLLGHSEQVTSIDFNPRKASLLCSCDCNDEIRLWNIKESTCFSTFKACNNILLIRMLSFFDADKWRASHGGNRQVRFQPRQGNLLAAASGNVISLIDVETSMVQYRFEGHEKDVCSLCWDVCGEYLVSTSEDSTRIWSLISGGKCIHELHSGGRDFASCTFHPGYSQVVVVGSYQSIYIWNPTMGNRTWTFPAHQGRIAAMANAPETNMIASASHDQWIKLWK